MSKITVGVYWLPKRHLFGPDLGNKGKIYVQCIYSFKRRGALIKLVGFQCGVNLGAAFIKNHNICK